MVSGRRNDLTKEQFLEIRTSLGLSQKRLAEILDCSEQWIYYIERGKRNISTILEAALRSVVRDQVGVRAIAYDGSPIVFRDVNPLDPHWVDEETEKRIRDPFRFMAGRISGTDNETNEGEAIQ